jgi:8-oxo-dGTP pyrophosphatase MutT (NUDIX family)
MKRTVSAGGVVLGPGGRVLVVSQKGDSWSLPKGHLDPGETPLEAARREIAEEAGITDLTFLRELGSYERPRIAKGGKGDDPSEIKQIILYLFSTHQTELCPIDKDHPEARWVEKSEVAALLTHPKDKEFFSIIFEKLKEAT